MIRHDAVWYAALALLLLGLSDLRAQQTPEEASKQAYEQLQGGSAGKGATQPGGLPVQGQPGSKEFTGAMSDPKKLGPDGKAPPMAGSAPAEPDRSPGAMAATGAKVGAVLGGAVGAIFVGGITVGTLAVPGWAVGAAVGAAAGGAFGYGMGKIGQWMDSTSQNRNDAINRAGS